MLFPSFLSIALVSASAVASAKPSGCHNPIPSGFPQPGHSSVIQLPGSDRKFRLYIPASYKSDKPTPVYFSFHGAGGDMDKQEALSQFSNPEFNPDGIAIYPNSTNGYWLSNPNAITSRPNDLDFTGDLLTHVEESLCVDTNKVYSAGKSNGGGFTAVIACDSTVGRRFAAFASVSGAYYNTDNIPGVGPCKPGKREGGYPFFEFHGTTDTTAPIDGNTKTPPKKPVIDFLHTIAEINGCDANAKWAKNETIFDKPLVKHASWDCDGKEAILQHHRESENGHCWPSTVSNGDYKRLPDQCKLGHYVYNATEYIFDFFSKYQLNH